MEHRAREGGKCPQETEHRVREGACLSERALACRRSPAWHVGERKGPTGGGAQGGRALAYMAREHARARVGIHSAQMAEWHVEVAENYIYIYM